MEVMSTQFFTLVLTFIGVLVIGAAKYYERKVSGSTEPWSDAKFGMFFVVAAGVMIVEYVYTGNMVFPADTIVESLMTFLNPIFLIFGAAYSAIIAGKVAKETLIKPTIASLKPAAPASSGIWTYGGYSVTPAYKEGKSPLTVDFNIYSTVVTSDHPGVTSVEVDWADGTNQTVIPVNGVGKAQHTFTFAATPKYTGHTFFPIFVYVWSDGHRETFNLDGRGVEIWVQA